MGRPVNTSSRQHPALRMTRQRKAVLSELQSATSHPTAAELYDRVRQRIPHISLGTVYRTLELLSQQGIIRVVQFDGVAKRRFDGKTENHYHARCLRCGRVDDVPAEELEVSVDVPANVAGYRIVSYRYELLGVCPYCGNGARD